MSKSAYSPLPSQSDEEASLGQLEELETTPTIYSLKSFVFWAVVVVACGSANAVSSKIVSVPMADYIFFISICNAIVYVVVYFVILLGKYLLKWTPIEQLRYIWLPSPTPKSCNDRVPPIKYFVVMGLMDGIGTLLSFLGRSVLPGNLTVLLPQTSLFFLVCASMTVLRTRYTHWQLWCVLLTLCGVFITLLPQLKGNSSGEILYIIIMAISPLPSAISSVLKEKLFADYPGLDTIIVNSHSSLFQLLLQPAIVPLIVIVNPKILSGLTLTQYLRNALFCFGGSIPHLLGMELTNSDHCPAMPWPYVIYISINVFFNISILFLLRSGTALMVSMVTNMILPISVMLFYFNWPLLPKPQSFSFETILGLVIILVGIGAYKWASEDKKSKDLGCCSTAVPCLDNFLDSRMSSTTIN